MRSLSVVTLGISHFAAALFSRALCTDREAFAAYELLEPAQQVTAQTARTLVQGDDAGLVRAHKPFSALPPVAPLTPPQLFRCPLLAQPASE